MPLGRVQVLPGVSDAVTAALAAAGDGTAYAVSVDQRLVGVNAAWARFALENAGERVLAEWPLGSSVLEATAPVLRPFFTSCWERVLATQRPLQHDYMCHTPTHERWFRMMLLPIRNDAIVVVSSQLVATPYARTVTSEPLSSYRRADKLITMCCHCRRTRNVRRARWDWVPAFIADPPRTVSHGLCPTCELHHYGTRPVER